MRARKFRWGPHKLNGQARSKPQDSQYYQYVEEHFERFKQVCDDRFLKQYGCFRPCVKQVIYCYLICGILHTGFARVVDVWYKHHVEACHVFQGEGKVEVLEPTPATHSLLPGTMYATNQHNKHILRAKKTLKLACVFNPPITGLEVHDADGAYPPSG